VKKYLEPDTNNSMALGLCMLDT